MIPTQRSVIARFRYSSLDGGWSKRVLCSATRTREFSAKAVMDRKIFVAERKVTSLCTSSVEQYSSAMVFLFFSPVMFVNSAISLQNKSASQSLLKHVSSVLIYDFYEGQDASILRFSQLSTGSVEISFSQAISVFNKQPV